MPSRSILFIAGAGLAVGVAVIMWLTVLSGPRTFSVTADGAELRFTDGSFGSGVTPTLTTAPTDDPFVTAFGLASRSSQPVVASVAAPAQPDQEIEVVFDADLDALPEHVVPAVFQHDADTGLWLPLPTVVDDAGRLVGTTDHISDFTAAVLAATHDEWRGVQWLRFQVAADAAAADCVGDAPLWLLDIDQGDGTAAPVRACAESGPGDELVLKVASAGPYSLALGAPVAPAHSSWSSAGSPLDGQPLAGPGDSLVTIDGVQTVLSWPAGSLPAGTVTIPSTATPETTLLDTVLAGAQVLAELGGDQAAEYGEAVACALATTDTDAAIDCLGALANTVPEPARDRMLDGMRTGVALDTGGSDTAGSTISAAAVLQQTGEIALQLAEILPLPPDGATLLPDALTGLEVGYSGDPVKVLIGDVYAGASATQWVGCDDLPAAAEYALAGSSRFTGLLGARDYMPDDIVADIRILVDGELLTEFEMGTAPIPVDVALPAGDVLRIEAHRIAGVCGPAPDGYLVWGNGALLAD